MLFRLDPTSADPLYVQLGAQIRGAVARAELAPGERLPSARDLAAGLEVNLHTVLRAYQELRDEGLIELRRGRGAVVGPRAADDYGPLNAAIASVVDVVRRQGVAPGTAVALLKEALR